MKSIKGIARVLKILAVEPRLKILDMLGEHPYCVCKIASAIGITEGAVSQHMRILRDAGLVDDVRCGYYIHYRLERKQLDKIIGNIHGFLSAVAAKKEVQPCPPPIKNAGVGSKSPDKAGVRRSKSRNSMEA